MRTYATYVLAKWYPSTLCMARSNLIRRYLPLRKNGLKCLSKPAELLFQIFWGEWTTTEDQWQDGAAALPNQRGHAQCQPVWKTTRGSSYATVTKGWAWNISVGRRFDNALYSFEERLSFLIVHAIIKDHKPVLLLNEYRPPLCNSNKRPKAAFVNVSSRCFTALKKRR